MKDKPLTVKQKKFVKAYVKNDGNGTKAALETYNTVDERTASAISSENLSKPNIRNAVEQSFIKHQITIDDAIAPIAKAMKAKRTYYAEGVKIETDDDDLEMQLKGSDRYLKFMGADKGEAQVPAAVHFHQHIEGKKGDYDF